MKTGDNAWVYDYAVHVTSEMGAKAHKGKIIGFEKGRIAVLFQESVYPRGIYHIPKALVKTSPKEAQKAHEIWKVLKS